MVAKLRVQCTCPRCGKAFETIPSRIRSGRGKYCSRQCQFGVPREERFWALVDKDGPSHPRLGTACWLWMGSCSGGGLKYGRFTDGRKIVQAHRYSYMLAHGPIPDGLDICHACDNPRCVRPDHLHAGTASENVREMWDRGRKRVDGARNPAAKLTLAQVEQIRSLYGCRGQKGFTLDHLARMFGVTTSAVHRVIKGQTWRKEVQS